MKGQCGGFSHRLEMANDYPVCEITKRKAAKEVAQDRAMLADIGPAALVDTPSI